MKKSDILLFLFTFLVVFLSIMLMQAFPIWR